MLKLKKNITISLIEPGVAWLEKRPIKRRTATFILTGIAWGGGILCVNFSEVFTFLDDLTTKYTLPIGGLLIAIFVGWVLPDKTVAPNFKISGGIVYNSWYWCLRVVAPLGVLVIILNQLEVFS